MKWRTKRTYSILLFINGLTKLTIFICVLLAVIGIVKNNFNFLILKRLMVVFGIQLFIYFLTKFFIKNGNSTEPDISDL